MTEEVCLEPVKGNMYKFVDCETGKPTNPCGRGVSKDGRKGRKPSAYNIFIGECIKKKSGPIPERMKSCSKEWKSKK